MITMEDLAAGRVDFADVVEADIPDVPRAHPGEHIRDWLDQTGVTAYALAKAMHVPANRLGAILAGERAITADTALRLAAATGASAEFWLGLQTSHDLEMARRAYRAEDMPDELVADLDKAIADTERRIAEAGEQEPADPPHDDHADGSSTPKDDVPS